MAKAAVGRLADRGLGNMGKEGRHDPLLNESASSSGQDFVLKYQVKAGRIHSIVAIGGCHDMAQLGANSRPANLSLPFLCSGPGHERLSY